jgi:membrane-associated phospholipid phosphatase
VITQTGGAVVLTLIVAAVVFALVRRRSARDAVLLVVVAVGIQIINPALKLAFHRPRPELSFVHLDTYSFPSGHAAGATAIYGALVFLAARRASVARRVTLVAGAVVVIALVDFSRLYLGAHYLSDVLAGSALGASWLALCLLVYELRR